MFKAQTNIKKIESEESLRSSRELMKQFATHLQKVREKEKGNISSVLHDGLGQNLTGLKIYAHRVLNGLNDGLTKKQVDALREQMTEMIGIIDGTFNEVRKIAKDIRPRILEEFGLVSAIELFLREFTSSRGFKYELIKKSGIIEIDKVSSLEVYRIIEEIISHIICRPGTTMLTVKISGRKQFYFIEIYADANDQNEPRSFVVNSMRISGLLEKAKLIGGNLNFNVDSTNTIIVLSIPKLKQND